MRNGSVIRPRHGHGSNLGFVVVNIRQGRGIAHFCKMASRLADVERATGAAFSKHSGHKHTVDRSGTGRRGGISMHQQSPSGVQVIGAPQRTQVVSEAGPGTRSPRPYGRSVCSSASRRARRERQRVTARMAMTASANTPSMPSSIASAYWPSSRPIAWPNR